MLIDEVGAVVGFPLIVVCARASLAGGAPRTARPSAGDLSRIPAAAAVFEIPARGDAEVMS